MNIPTTTKHTNKSPRIWSAGLPSQQRPWPHAVHFGFPPKAILRSPCLLKNLFVFLCGGMNPTVNLNGKSLLFNDRTLQMKYTHCCYSASSVSGGVFRFHILIVLDMTMRSRTTLYDDEARGRSYSHSKQRHLVTMCEPHSSVRNHT